MRRWRWIFPGSVGVDVEEKYIKCLYCGSSVTHRDTEAGVVAA